jgi:hypothetical protein
MFSKSVAKLALVSAIMIVPIAQAHAYSIHVKNGVYTIECDNGVKSTGSTLQVSHAQAAYFCKVRNSSISTPEPNPSTGGKAAVAQERARIAPGN